MTISTHKVLWKPMDWYPAQRTVIVPAKKAHDKLLALSALQELISKYFISKGWGVGGVGPSTASLPRGPLPSSPCEEKLRLMAVTVFLSSLRKARGCEEKGEGVKTATATDLP